MELLSGVLVNVQQPVLRMGEEELICMPPDFHGPKLIS